MTTEREFQEEVTQFVNEHGPIAMSPWVQRNLDNAQYVQPRGSQYPGPGPKINHRFTCSGYCGTSVMDWTHTPRCERMWDMYMEGIATIDWIKYQNEIRDMGGQG
jgi:hypothetical protein